jgi:integrase
MTNTSAAPKHRRPRGSGSCRQRAEDGLWVARTYTGEGSAKTRLVAYGKTAAEAQLKLDAKRSAASQGRPQTPAGMTVARQLSDWLDTLPSDTRPATRRLYGYLAGLATSELGSVKVRALTATDVERASTRLAARGLGPQTRSKVQMALRSALKRAERDFGIPNAARLADPVKGIPAPARTALSEAQIATVMEALNGWERRAAIAAVSTGLRAAELLGLRARDVDWQAEPPMLHVTHQLQRQGGEYRLVELKTESSKRDIPLTPDAVAALLEELAAQRKVRERAGAKWAAPIPGGEDLIFTVSERGPARPGSPRSGSSLGHQLQRTLARAGLPPMTWHSLRAVFANRLSIPVEVVSALLGHSSIGVTLKSYAKVSEGRKAQAMADLPRLDLTRRLEGSVPKAETGLDTEGQEPEHMSISGL